MITTSNCCFASFARSLSQATPDLQQPLTISLVGGGGKTHMIHRLAREFKRAGHRVCVTTTTKMYLPDGGFDVISNTENAKPLSQPGISFLYQNLIAPDSSHKKTDTLKQTKVQGLSIEQFTALYRYNGYSVYLVEADGANQLAIKAPAGHEPCIPYQSNVIIGVTGAESILTPLNPDSVHRWSEFSQLTGCKAGSVVDKNILKTLVSDRNGMFKNCSDNQSKVWVINKWDLAHNQQQLLKVTREIFKDEASLSQILITQLNGCDPIQHIFSRTPNSRAVSEIIPKVV